MKRPTLTVTRKVAAGYLLIVAFALVAIIYALNGLHDQTARSQHLISVDFHSLELARNLRQNLLAQESLEKQFLILRDPAFLDLLERRREELNSQWSKMAALPLADFLPRLAPLYAGYFQQGNLCRAPLEDGQWAEAESCLAALAPWRQDLLTEFEGFLGDRQQLLDQALIELNRTSARAYRVTLFLAFLGIALSAPAALAIVISIHRTVTVLIRATREVAAGNFDQPIPLTGRRDEFGVLAREFQTMREKLRELEQLRLDANPLTHLPGNRAIDRELETRLRNRVPFAHLYIDLDHFKAYSDRYGYLAGSDVISRMADLIRPAVERHGTPGDLVGHIGGDDFVVITDPDHAESLACAIVEEFDRRVPEFYSEEDRRAGCFVAEDRFGEKRKFPLLTVSIAIVCSDHLDSPSPQAVSQACVNMKEHLKSRPGSNVLIDRRRIV